MIMKARRPNTWKGLCRWIKWHAETFCHWLQGNDLNDRLWMRRALYHVTTSCRRGDIELTYREKQEVSEHLLDPHETILEYDPDEEVLIILSRQDLVNG